VNGNTFKEMMEERKRTWTLEHKLERLKLSGNIFEQFLNSFCFSPPLPNYTLTPDIKMLITYSQNWIPALWITKADAKATILYSHGNAEDIGDVMDIATYMAEYLNVNVLIYDYTGYGHSKINPKEEQAPSIRFMYEDIVAAFRFIESKGVKLGDLILYGRSLGSAPTIELAQILSTEPLYQTDTLKGLILECPFASVTEFSKNKLPGASKQVFKTCASAVNSASHNLAEAVDLLNNAQKLERVKAGFVYLFHGKNDDIIPYYHSEVLFEAVKEEKKKLLLLNEAGHNDLHLNHTTRNIILSSVKEQLYLQPGKGVPGLPQKGT